MTSPLSLQNTIVLLFSIGSLSVFARGNSTDPPIPPSGIGLPFASEDGWLDFECEYIDKGFSKIHCQFYSTEIKGPVPEVGDDSVRVPKELSKPPSVGEVEELFKGWCSVEEKERFARSMTEKLKVARPKAKEHLTKTSRILSDFCATKNPDKLRELTAAEDHKKSRTCRIIRQSFSVGFIKRDDGLWINDGTSLGSCHLNVFTLEKERKSQSVIRGWNFKQSRVPLESRGKECAGAKHYSIEASVRFQDEKERSGCDFFTPI